VKIVFFAQLKKRLNNYFLLLYLENTAHKRRYIIVMIRCLDAFRNQFSCVCRINDRIYP